MKLEFSLINNENTDNLLQNIRNKNFKVCKIDKKSYLTFIEIEDYSFIYVATIQRNEDNLHELQIFDDSKKETIKILLSEIQSIYTME